VLGIAGISPAQFGTSRLPGYRLPTLEDARYAWERYIGQGVTWPESVELVP
jgi:hypothetical protein